MEAGKWPLSVAEPIENHRRQAVALEDRDDLGTELLRLADGGVDREDSGVAFASSERYSRSSCMVNLRTGRVAVRPQSQAG
jgi:hypothetical protein